MELVNDSSSRSISTGIFDWNDRGAIRIAVSLATTILTIVIVVAASPYVSSAIEKHTPIDDMIKSQVTNTMAKAAASQLAGGSDDSGSTGISAESVRKALKAAGISEEELQSYGVSVDDIVNGKITGEQLAQYGISSSILDGVNNDEVSEEVKNAIEGADIPRDLQVTAMKKKQIFQQYLRHSCLPIITVKFIHNWEYRHLHSM